MNNDLRTLFPTQIIRGALLRPDGVAVGLVSGGAPAWDLLSLAARADIGSAYHKLLLSLDAPIDVYVVDQPPDLASEIAALLDRQDAHDRLLLEVRSQMADYLMELAAHSGSRTKQVIWAVTAAGSANDRGVDGMDIRRLIARRARADETGSNRAGHSALTQATQQARRLADALSQLGGTPAPRLMEAEEIARLVYMLADPVRAQRYPLSGTLLDRVCRVITPTLRTPEHA
jgi:hypothetical protein